MSSVQIIIEEYPIGIDLEGLTPREIVGDACDSLSLLETQRLFSLKVYGIASLGRRDQYIHIFFSLNSGQNIHIYSSS